VPDLGVSYEIGDVGGGFDVGCLEVDCVEPAGEEVVS